MDNIILATDSYKVTHWKQYPLGTRAVYSYFESRGGKFNNTVFFGLQYILKRYFCGEVVTPDRIREAKALCKAHFGRDSLFNEAGWWHIIKDHGGRLPLSIKAVPEGTLVPTHNVLITVENTCDECYWLTNYVETLLVQVWYPTTVATISWHMRDLIARGLEISGDPSLIGFKLHDFGYRGVSSNESAGIGGVAHLVNFLGTDTVPALLFAQDYYEEAMAGFSIPAAEHSTITSWGKEHEAAAYANMLRQFGGGLVAVVSDSYDIYKACEQYWGADLKKHVEEMPGGLVIRPDSGNPVDVLPKVFELLWKKFGGTINTKGFRVLNPKVRIIWGDGITLDSTPTILASLINNGISVDNIAFGMGGGLLQKCDRDTQKFAFKCSAININGSWRDVFKDPVTDPGKKSKRGRLALIRPHLDTSLGAPGWYTVEESAIGTDPSRPGGSQTYGVWRNELIEVYRDGALLKEYTLKEVRERAWPTPKSSK